MESYCVKCGQHITLKNEMVNNYYHTISNLCSDCIEEYASEIMLDGWSKALKYWVKALDNLI
jgi:NMD protein affecting ribosome stability and mRNA decay